MAKIIKEAIGRQYQLTCKHCGSVSVYNEFEHDHYGRRELSHYEDCHDKMLVEYQCPVCGKHTSIYERDLEKHNVDNLEIKHDKNHKKSFQKLIVLIIILLIGIGIGMLLINYII